MDEKPTYRRGLARREIERFELDDPRLVELAARSGPVAWLTQVEGGAAAVLRDAGFTLAEDKLGYFIVGVQPDRDGLTAIERAKRVLDDARCARVALSGNDPLMTFEWGARLMESAQGLSVELAGWPLAAEVGSKVRGGGGKGGQQTASQTDVKRHQRIEAIKAALLRDPSLKPKQIHADNRVHPLFSSYGAFGVFLHTHGAAAGYKPTRRKL
ncbi:MAG: hypothetical protein U1E17_21060 [Geminicoccaceae bacterium]